MARVEDSHYKVVDERGILQGYFETEGLAHQYLLEEYPWPKGKKQTGKRRVNKYKDGQVMPMAMFIKKVKKK